MVLFINFAYLYFTYFFFIVSLGFLKLDLRTNFYFMARPLVGILLNVSFPHPIHPVCQDPSSYPPADQHSHQPWHHL